MAAGATAPAAVGIGVLIVPATPAPAVHAALAPAVPARSHSRCCCWPAPTCLLLLAIICTSHPSFACAGLRLHWPGPLSMAPCLLLSVAMHLALCRCCSCRRRQWCCRRCHCRCRCAYGLVVSPVRVRLPCPSLCGTLPVTEQLVIYCLFCTYLSILDSTYLQSK